MFRWIFPVKITTSSSSSIINSSRSGTIHTVRRTCTSRQNLIRFRRSPPTRLLHCTTSPASTAISLQRHNKCYYSTFKINNCDLVGDKGITLSRTRNFSTYHPIQTRDTMASSTGLERISTSGSAPPAAPYSQAIKANGQIWISGQVHLDENNNKVEGSVTEKTRQCCKNLKAIIDAAGSSMDKIVRVGVFLVDMADFKEMNEEYAKWFTHKPARACVAVHQLPLGCTVEIEAIALA